MKPNRPLNPPSARPRLVGVIASREALLRATRLRRLPDFFELRLDALSDSFGEIERHLPRLRAPLILTARAPAEGGHHNLSLAVRRRLIERFLDRAALVDLELRSVRQMQDLLATIRRRSLGLILSWHDLQETPSPNDLQRRVRSAARWRPDLVKIVTCTDTSEQLARLVTFFHGCNAGTSGGFARRGAAESSTPESAKTSITAPSRGRRPRKAASRHGPALGSPTPLVAAMGVGRLGLRSRLALERLGSTLTYAAVGEPILAGQPSLSQLRRARQAYYR